MEKERLYYADWLRVLVVLSLIPYHAALTYTGIGSTYIIKPIHNSGVLPFIIITASLDSFFMALLFFVSGIATFYSLHHENDDEFIRERLRKLLVPLLLGLMILCPIQAYFKGLYEGFSGSFLEFIPEFFSPKIGHYLFYAHLWFLFYLFIFSFICLPLFRRWINQEQKLNKLSLFLCKGNNIYIPILYISITEMILRPFFPGSLTLIMDWANDIVYLSLYIFGFVYASDKKIQERVSKLAGISGIFAITVPILYMIMDYLFLTEGKWVPNSTILWASTKGFYECCAIIFFVWVGKKYLNRKSSILSYLSKGSFAYYLLHYIPVSMFTYYSINLDINIYIKYLFVILMSYLFIFVIYEIFVRNLFPFINRKIGVLRRSY
jgi:hypothetical protein